MRVWGEQTRREQKNASLFSKIPEKCRQAESPSSSANLPLALDADDVRRLVAGVRRVREIFARAPLADYVIAEAEPGLVRATSAQLGQWVQDAHTTNSHWCCSASFGEHGALDPKTLAVRGLAITLPSLRKREKKHSLGVYMEDFKGS